MKLSVVTTLYQSMSFVKEFHERVSREAQQITDDYEIIFVDDGSTDSSVAAVKELLERDYRTRLIVLARNFGHHKAIATGLGFAKGELIFLVDCDLEEPPELLGQFYALMLQDPDLAMVGGVQGQGKRRGRWFDRNVSGLYYLIFNFLSDDSIPHNQSIVRLMTKNYVSDLLQFREHDYVLGGILTLVGHKQLNVEIKKGFKGTSTYDLTKKIKVLVDSITSFSVKPLELIFLLGFVMSVISILMIATLVFKKYVLGIRLEGWTSTVASIWLIGGIMIFCQGVIGIYIARIFLQVKNRPFSLVKEVYNIDGVSHKLELRTHNDPGQIT